MRNLVRRYVTQEQRKAENEGVTEDDVNEIKNDISAFRFELIEIMRASGMNTQSATGPSGLYMNTLRYSPRFCPVQKVFWPWGLTLYLTYSFRLFTLRSILYNLHFFIFWKHFVLKYCICQKSVEFFHLFISRGELLSFYACGYFFA